MENIFAEEVEEEIKILRARADAENRQQEEEPFAFAMLPSDLQYKIVDRFNYAHFSVLDQTSRIGHAVCWQKTYTAKHEIATVFVNKKTVKIRERWGYYYYYERPLIRWHVAARAPVQLVANEALKPREIHFYQFVPREFFKVAAIENMERLVLRSSGFTDDELLRLKCNYIYAENEFVTAKGLNRLLRQWKKKERDITDITIGFDTSFGTRNFQTILDGLDANPIWTPDLHEHSLIAKIKLEEFDPMLTGDPDHIYSICRSDDINNTRFLLLSQGRFEVIKEENEAEFLMEYLTAEQYYILFGKCSYCDMKFCRHRRQYSTQRLKILYPRLYKLITFGFKGLMYHFGLLRVEKVLLGERPFTRPPLFEYERMNYESGFCRLLSNLRVLFFDHV